VKTNGGWGWKKNTRGQFKQVLSEEKRELRESAKMRKEDDVFIKIP